MSKPKIVLTIEARMTSSRLPGKVLLPVDGKPILAHMVERLKLVPSVDEIVLATTVNKTDDVLIEFAKPHGISVFRGSEDDVMSRIVEAATSAKADIVVETTGDCPVIDPQVIEQIIQLFLNNACDYASNVEVRSYPIGMDTQVFRAETLRKSLSMTTHPLDREHVTRHIRMNPQMFRQLHLVSPPDSRWPELGLTLDEPKDYELLKSVIEYFTSRNRIDFTCAEILRMLETEHPEWVLINQDVRRKGLHQ
jgi:spore coat polysaccharide biosynthesis protein SpsF